MFLLFALLTIRTTFYTYHPKSLLDTIHITIYHMPPTSNRPPSQPTIALLLSSAESKLSFALPSRFFPSQFNPKFIQARSTVKSPIIDQINDLLPALNSPEPTTWKSNRRPHDFKNPPPLERSFQRVWRNSTTFLIQSSFMRVWLSQFPFYKSALAHAPFRRSSPFH